MYRAAVPRQWAAKIDALDLPEHGCSISALVDQVAAFRGRPIHLVPINEAPGRASGYVFQRADSDVIKYEVSGGGRHQANAVAHELAHLLLDHDPGESAPDSTPCSDRTGGALQLIDDGILEVMTPRVMCRTDFDETAEAEAETMAWLLLDRISRRGSQPPVSGGPLAAALVHRPSRRRR